MNIKSILFFFIFISQNVLSQSFEWAEVLTKFNVQIVDVAIDDEGNSFVIGNFWGTLDVDPSSAVFEIVEPHDDYQRCNFFIEKLDSLGNFVWAKSFGGNWKDEASTVCLDDKNNIYISGVFHDSVDFDPGQSEFNLTAFNKSGFILKLNQNGDFSFARMIGGSGSIETNILALDNEGKVYSAGLYRDTIDFDPGSDILIGVDQSSALYDYNVYVEKFDTNGIYVWAKFIGNGDYKTVKSLNVDHLNRLHLTGTFSDSVDLDPSNAIDLQLSSPSSGVSSFIVSLNSDGAYMYGSALNSDSSNINISNSSIDGEGNVYFVGFAQGKVDFDTDVNEQFSHSDTGFCFLLKQDVGGNYIWHKSFDFGSWNEKIFVSSNHFGSVYLAGTFQDTVDFDFGPNQILKVADSNSGGIFDSYILELDGNGEFKDVKIINSPINDFYYTFNIDKQGSIYATGNFETSLDCSPDSLEHILESPYPGIYMFKWSRNVHVDSLDEFNVYPNPFSEELMIDLGEMLQTVTFTIVDLNGSIVSEFQCDNCSSNSLNLSRLNSGLYFLKISNEGQNRLIKVMKY